jgi:UDP:flavonoid glycosyltransferase YjiC (YdhE family)
MNESGLRVLICPFGTLGEIQPAIALGATLRQRGHEVRILAPAVYHRHAQALGLDFVAVGSAEKFDAFMAQQRLWHPTFGYPLLAGGIVDMIEPGYAAVLAHHAKGRTVLVHSWMFVGARIAREAQNIPAVTLHPYPMIFRSRFDPPQIPPLPLRKGSPVWNDVWYRVIDRLMDHWLAGPVNAFRAKLGLAPVRRIMRDWIHSPDGAIGLFPEWFAAPQADWPRQAALTGFPLYDGGRDEQLSAGLLRFLDEGPPPIVFTSGGAMRHAGAFFRTAVEICRASARRGVLLAPFGTQLRDLPPFMHSAPYVPFSRLLPRAAALVHHGGIGTIAQALVAGTPQVAVPVVFDHADNSARMARLGVGCVVAPHRFSASTGIGAIECVSSSKHEASRNRVKAMFAGADDPLARSAELIEAAACRST